MSLCVGDAGALLLGPWPLTADPQGPLLDQDEESSVLEGSWSPSSSSSSSLSSFSPPASGDAPSELLSLSWQPSDVLLTEQSTAGDVFPGMDWMTEKLDLNDFDLDSLIGSCDSEDPPGSPEDLLACLDSSMDLDLDSLPFGSADLDLPLGLDLPLPEEIKSEPLSPAPSVPSPPEEAPQDENTEVPVLHPAGIMLSLSPSHIVVLLTPKEEQNISDCSDSDSGISVSGSPAHQSDLEPSSRAKPYSRPDPEASPALKGRVKTSSGAPKVEKKLKKMEQNKTAATRYRQKKRVEQESLNSECSELEKKNRELSEKADSLSREIQYLRDLLEEMRTAKQRKSKR